MIIKKREMPLQLKKLKALERRLSPSHPKHLFIKEALTRKLAGYKGEQSIDFPLSFLDPHRYLIFHHLRLFDGTHHFQMDTVLLTPHFLLIIEVKNIAGSITMNQEFPQMIRTIDNKEEAFADPITQLERQKLQLKQWLAKNTSIVMPVEGVVVMTNERAVVRNISTAISGKMIPNSILPQHLRKMEQAYKNVHSSSRNVEFLEEKLKRKHSEFDSDILKQYELADSDIIVGVICEKCFTFSMTWQARSWHCTSCGGRVPNAHFSALEDYSFLHSPSITNRDARKFLRVSSPDIAKRLIQSYAKRYIGKTSGRKYLLR